MNKFYSMLPVSIQNLAISLYGFKVKRERFGSYYKKVISDIDIERHPKINESEIRNHLIHAASTVPFYRDRVSLEGVVNSKNLEEAISHFPIISKQDVVGNESEFLSMDSPKRKISIKTSGSTGTPLVIYLDRRSLEYNYAFFHYFLKYNGLSEFDRSATFAGRLIVPVEHSRPPFHRINKAMNTMLLSSYHIRLNNSRSYYESIVKWRPKFIDSYPSSIYELVRFFEELGLSRSIDLKAIVTSSETLLRHQRLALENFFSCNVYDYYGCAEQAALAFQLWDTEEKYVVPSQYCLMEVLDSNDYPVKGSEAGRIVCTNVFNKVMPLIRYDIGDNGVLESYYEDTFFAKTLSSIEGRADDVIVNEFGTKVGRLDPVFKNFNGLKEVQIVQHALNEVEVKVVPLKNKETDERALAAALKARLGSSVNISFTYLDRIPRGKSGKFRSVISKIN